MTNATETLTPLPAANGFTTLRNSTLHTTTARATADTTAPADVIIRAAASTTVTRAQQSQGCADLSYLGDLLDSATTMLLISGQLGPNTVLDRTATRAMNNDVNLNNDTAASLVPAAAVSVSRRDAPLLPRLLSN